MSAKGPDLLKSRAGFQQRDVDPNKGCYFIISDGSIHVESCTKELQEWNRSITDGTSMMAPYWCNLIIFWDT
jgi:hypothetical protein